MLKRFFNEIAGPESQDRPNRFTKGMGELIREARLAANLSQVELAKAAYFRQASISDIENGKREVSSSELVYLSYALDKPIPYFFPAPWKGRTIPDSLSEDEEQLLLIANQLEDDDIKRLIAQAAALLKLSKS